MPGRQKKMLKDLRTGKIYESLYAAGKDIGPREYAEGSPKNPAGKIKQDQHVWFAIHRDKENAGRFQVSEDGGQTFVDYPFAASRRKTAAERKVAAEAKAAKGGTATATSTTETKEQRIARLRAELEAANQEATPAASNGGSAATPVEEEETAPVKGRALAGNMKVAKTG